MVKSSRWRGGVRVGTETGTAQLTAQRTGAVLVPTGKSRDIALAKSGSAAILMQVGPFR